MKVLFWTYGRNRFVYPDTKVTGGIEMVEMNQLHALKQLGYDVTVALTQDSECSEFKSVTLPLDSFEACGRYRTAKAIDFIDSIVDDYDVILTNRPWSLAPHTKRLQRIKPWVPKLRQINHEPPAYLKGYTFPHIVASTKWLSLNGAKTATVMKNGNAIFDGLEERLRSGASFSKLVEHHNRMFDALPVPSFTDFYEVMVVGDDFRPLNEVSFGEDIVFVGRPTKVKGLPNAVYGAEEAQRLDDFIGFTAPPSGASENKNWANIEELQKHFTVSAPHDRIMYALTTASVFLQPTLSESAGGIVAFEAAAHGVPVITSTDTCKRYLEPYGLYHHIKNRRPTTIAQAINSLTPLSVEEKQEIATRVREDFSQEVYAQNLARFLDT